MASGMFQGSLPMSSVKHMANGGTKRQTRIPISMTANRILSAVLIIATVACVLFLYATAPTTAEKPNVQQGVPVKTIQIKPQTIQTEITAYGVVEAARRVKIAAEVSGRVISIHPNLMEGAHFNKGDTLFEIEKTNYKNALIAAESNLQIAQANLHIEQGQQQVALKDWGQLRKMSDVPNSDDSLILRGPQLARSIALVTQAESNLNIAQKNLERTHISAPIPAYVTQKSIEVGQIITAGETVAELVGSQYLHIKASVRKEDLASITIGASATVKHPETDQLYSGTVRQVLPQLSEKNRLGQVIIEVPVTNHAPSALKIMDFIHVSIAAGAIDKVYAIPAHAYQESGHVYITTPNGGVLDIRKAKAEWRSADQVYVSMTLTDEEHVIISPLANAYNGMSIKMQGVS